jgi:hypothetical protein
MSWQYGDQSHLPGVSKPDWAKELNLPDLFGDQAMNYGFLGAAETDFPTEVPQEAELGLASPQPDFVNGETLSTVDGAPQGIQGNAKDSERTAMTQDSIPISPDETAVEQPAKLAASEAASDKALDPSEKRDKSVGGDTTEVDSLFGDSIVPSNPAPVKTANAQEVSADSGVMFGGPAFPSHSLQSPTVAGAAGVKPEPSCVSFMPDQGFLAANYPRMTTTDNDADQATDNILTAAVGAVTRPALKKTDSSDAEMWTAQMQGTPQAAPQADMMQLTFEATSAA